MSIDVLPPMKARRVMLQTASLVEAKPGLYDFGVCDTAKNPDCGTPHCLLGWFSAFIGRDDALLWDVAKAMGFGERGKVPDVVFYKAMRDIGDSRIWQDNAHEAARCLRLLADKMYPVGKTPNWNALAIPGDALKSQAGAMEVVR